MVRHVTEVYNLHGCKNHETPSLGDVPILSQEKGK